LAENTDAIYCLQRLVSKMMNIMQLDFKFYIHTNVLVTHYGLRLTHGATTDKFSKQFKARPT